MRVPLSWLAEYVDLAPGTTPEDVHAALVKVGFEEEDIHRSDVTGPVVVGEVLEFVEEEQSNGKSIRWCQVRVAKPGVKAADAAFGGTGEEIRGIVCGANNFAVGDKVIATLPGAVLPGGFEITPRKTYGHTSDGMMASAKELGLGDDHSGILVWSTLGLDPEIGTDAVGLLGLDDSAVEINVTPDRGYAFSIRGVAREYAHATGATFRDPAHHLPTTGGAHVAETFATDFPVKISDDAPIRGRAGASVFVTRVVEGVDATRPTPSWMTSRLRLAGVRPISLVVDITNYVMFELGQPIHGYDLDKLTGGITVRRANSAAGPHAAGRVVADGDVSRPKGPDSAGRVDPKGRIETLTTLDEQVRTLHAEDLVIADDSGAIGLAGVMGGAATEITDATTRVLVEAANFDPVSIARSARRHKLPSEASRRFERGVDPAVAEVAAGRVVQLLVDLAGGVVADHGSYVVGRVDPKGRIETTTVSVGDWFAREPIELPDGFVAGLIGYDYTAEQVRTSLAEIGGTIVEAKGALMVTPPSWRPDITDKWTLAEEVARIVGFDVIPALLPVAPPGRGFTVAQQVRRRVSDGLASAGHTETLAYPFFDEATNNLFGSASAGSVSQVRLANALDSEHGWMRTSLLPGLMQTAARNRSRGFTDLAIFEQGLVFRPVAGVTYGHAMLPGAVRPTDSQIAELNAGIPPQPRHIAGVQVGDAIVRQPGQKSVAVDWQDALAAVAQIAAASGVPINVRQGSHASFHPGRCAELVLGSSSSDAIIGYAGEILPAIAEAANLPGRVAAYELDLDAIAAAAGQPVEALPVPAMTAATQDVSLVVKTSVPAADVQNALLEGAGELLEHARLVDIYRGEGLPEGTHSLTFALRFRAPDRTLTQAEATEAKQAGVALAAERFGAAIRD
jgi:phenylalanyl-tRNA synthetase beta chain